MFVTAKIIARYTGRLVVRLLLTILAGDLLYLYYAGSWYDPIRAIEITEVILLYVFVVAGIVLTHREALKCRRELKYAMAMNYKGPETGK